MVQYSLGKVEASPEFSFPLQLIYLNSNTKAGLLGTGWFCPQLESMVVPRGRGMVVWTMPSGGVIGLEANPKRPGDYRSRNGEWVARVVAGRVSIRNQEGWEYSYSKGLLDSVKSPTGRLLEFLRSGSRLSGVQLRDAASNAILPLIAFDYANGSRSLAGLRMLGVHHQFAYEKDGALDRLSAWQSDAGTAARFKYDDRTNCLAASAVLFGDEKKPEITEYRTVSMADAKTAKASNQPAQRDPSRFWISEDKDFLYEYPNQESESIRVTRKADQKVVVGDLKGKEGILENQSDAGARRTIYYRAPGRKYDGKLRRIEENGRLLVEYRYDRKTGLLSEWIDENGIITFLDYPPRSSTSGSFDPKPIRVRRGTRAKNEIVAEYAYDKAGRVLAAKDASGNVTTFTYTPRGEIASVTNATGRTNLAYDALGRVVAINKDGRTEKVEYDRAGLVASRTSASGLKSDFKYDARGRLVGVLRDGKQEASFTRDAFGRATAIKDPLGRTKNYEYDAKGHVTAEHLPNGSVTRYEYDALGQRTAQIDGNGNRIVFEYDLSGHLIKQTNPLGNSLTWTYDPAGRLVERTNGVQTIAYRYDEKNRLAQIDYDAVPGEAAAEAAAAAAARAAEQAGPGANTSYFGTYVGENGNLPTAAPVKKSVVAAKPAAGKRPQTIDYTYDTEGRLLTAKTPDTEFEYIRDNRGRVEAQRCIADGKEQLLRYRYDNLGRRTGLILAELIPAVEPTGGKAGKPAEYNVLQQTEYTYDSASRLASIIDNGTEAIHYTYDGMGRLATKVFGNGMRAIHSYDPQGRLAKVEFKDGPLTEPKVLEYTWDAADQVTKRAWNGETQRYEYDAGGQLLKVLDDANNSALESYAYDKAGNMLEKIIQNETTKMTYDASNQLASFQDTTALANSTADKPAQPSALRQYSYDRSGRMLGYQGGSTNEYGWLDKVTELTQPDGTKVSYLYWPDGQLALKKPKENSSDVNETFLWDGLALLRRKDTIYLIEPHPSGGVPIAAHAANSNQTVYFLNDMLGTTLARINGENTEFVKLTTFGQPIGPIGNSN